MNSNLVSSCRMVLFFIFFTAHLPSIQSQCFESVSFPDPGDYVFTVPSDGQTNYIVEIDVIGADGGDFLWGTNPQTNGGEGARMKARFFLPAASELLVMVGAAGFDGMGDPAGGGGGGGSAVTIDNTEILIAAGAGGGGGAQASLGGGGFANIDSPAQGGNGPGSSGGGGFNDPGENGVSGTGGGAGSLLGLGSGGTGGSSGGFGGAGFGGGGGSSGVGGGGGGGYQGGDGGMNGDLGGEGGDSFLSDLFSGSLISATAGIDGTGAGVDGFVLITCIPVTDVAISLISSTSPHCFDSFDGSIEVSANGGVTPYMYALNGGVFGTENTFLDLDGGDYIITVMDQLGSTSSVSVTLESPPILENTLLNQVDNVCFGGFLGSIEVIGSGGSSTSDYSYSINGGPIQSTGLFTELSSGFFVVTVIDDNNCEAQVTADIESPLDILATVTNITGVTCSGVSDGTAMVFVSGGVGDFSFALDGGDFDVFDSFQNLDEGLHTILVQDANGCIESASFVVSAPGILSIDAVITDVACNGDISGMVSFNVTGGSSPYSYSFESNLPDSIGTYTGLSADIYEIEVVDQNGCSVMDSIEVMEPPVFELDIVTNTPATCGGEGLIVFNNISGLGDINYFIGDQQIASDTFNGEAGTYEVLAIDSAGCSTELVFEIEQLSNLSISLDTLINVTCFGGSDGSVTISNGGGIGPVTYSLDGDTALSSSVFDSLVSGTYIVSVLDSVGCTASTLITISEPEILNLQIEELIGIACFGDSTGSLSGLISGGSGVYSLQSSIGNVTVDSNILLIDSLSVGDLFVTLQDTQGCILNDTISIDGNPQLQVSIDSVASVDCAEGTMGYIALSGSGGFLPYTFESSGQVSDGVFEGLISDDYTFILEDSLGCLTSTDVNIGMLGSLIITGTGFSDVSCFGGNDGLYVLNIPNYVGDILWSIDGVSNPDSNFINLAAGQYTLSATDSFDCSVSLDIDINQPEELTGSITNEGNGTITILAEGGTEPYLYVINGQIAFQDSPIFTDLVEGSYVFTIIDANGCEFNLDQIITDVNNIEFSELLISPNPAFDLITIVDESNALGKMEVEIMDMNGRSMQTSITNRNQNSTTISIEDIPSGTYLVKIIGGGTFVVKRFVKM